MPDAVSSIYPRPQFLPAAIRKPLFLFSLLTLAACGEKQSSGGVGVSGGWQGTTVDDGSIRTVRTVSGSVWGSDGRLVEEVAIGTEARGEEDFLAAVRGIEVWNGLIYIADLQLSTIRVYDMDGNHVKDIGREGEGPGEFGMVSGVAIDPSREELVVRETIGIIHRLTMDGEFLHRTVPRWNMSFARPGLNLRVTRDGLNVFPQLFWEINPGGSPLTIQKFFLYTSDASGVLLDSLKLTFDSDQSNVLKAYRNTERQRMYRPQAVPYLPKPAWNVGFDGAFITGTGEDYRFEIQHPDGRKTVIERVADTVPVDPEEKAAQTRRVYQILRDVDLRWQWEGPEVPDTKAWYDEIIPDRSGRIWVRREGPGHPVEGWTEPEDWRGWKDDPEWVSELWYEVFDETTGKYLGRVPAPPDLDREQEPYIDGDLFVCLTRGEYDRPIVRRYRLEIPGQESNSPA